MTPSSSPPYSPSIPSWDELMSRDPFLLSEEDITKISSQLVQMARSQIEIWNNAAAAAKSTGSRISGTAVKKAQKEIRLPGETPLKDFFAPKK